MEDAMAKRKVATKPRRVTLRKVYEVATWDQAFLEALLINPEKALAQVGCSLSKKDLAALRRWLKKVFRIKGKNLVRLLMMPMKSKIYPWP
jgi:hypothetical protein